MRRSLLINRVKKSTGSLVTSGMSRGPVERTVNGGAWAGGAGGESSCGWVVGVTASQSSSWAGSVCNPPRPRPQPLTPLPLPLPRACTLEIDATGTASKKG